jgi:hypothetical protein
MTSAARGAGGTCGEAEEDQIRCADCAPSTTALDVDHREIGQA